MAWEELRLELTQLKAELEEGKVLWHVKGANKIAALWAHPVFLEDLRVSAQLPELLNGNQQAVVKVVRERRLILDTLLPNAEQARADLGITPATRYAEPGDLIPLLQHYDTVKDSGAVLKYKYLLVEATKWADAHLSDDASVSSFIAAHGLYVSAVQDLLVAFYAGVGPEPVEDVRGKLVEEAYALGHKAAEKARWGRAPWNAAAAWRSYDAALPQKAQEKAVELRFAAVHNLVGHSFKHILKESKQDKQTARFPGDQVFMDALVGLYQDSAQNRIKTFKDPVTSSMAQLGNHRTYFFGTVNFDVALVAVNEAGEVWITTYYAPERY